LSAEKFMPNLSGGPDLLKELRGRVKKQQKNATS